jgi:hypothetical protein
VTAAFDLDLDRGGAGGSSRGSATQSGGVVHRCRRGRGRRRGGLI